MHSSYICAKFTLVQMSKLKTVTCELFQSISRLPLRCLVGTGTRTFLMLIIIYQCIHQQCSLVPKMQWWYRLLTHEEDCIGTVFKEFYSRLVCFVGSSRHLALYTRTVLGNLNGNIFNAAIVFCQIDRVNKFEKN